MHELSCPSCGTASQYNLIDEMHLCQFCSASFIINLETGHKEIFGDHYIVPNLQDAPGVKNVVTEWLKRMHHKPEGSDRDFIVMDIRGVSLPYWVTSLDVHTVWKGLVKREGRNILKNNPGANYLVEQGEFRRSYRWAISGRRNICESWGLTQLHKPKEAIEVDWDGFPLDSTFSRGQIDPTITKKDGEEIQNVYDRREFFDYKYSNGLPITGIQVSQEEALRRARQHAELYHIKLAKLGVDHLIDVRTELEIAGVQLVHLPFWHGSYQYQPKNALKHFYRPRRKNVLVDGSGKGILQAELPIVHRDKVTVNAIVCAIAAVFLFLLGATIHPSFFLVSFFSLIIAAISGYVAMVRKSNEAQEKDIQHGGLGLEILSDQNSDRGKVAS